ncbi:MAG: MBL fold metallo-hydrolase [Candidatus Aminicenantes bacterium]|jgi:L-ascorbate metabolism protein UlaG (beta-lactamase superfamily)|nr:MBL fold metallo-hydrolase [Candidatus Aminicenantes bacterium]MDH5385572.1 MBL fold metallo-hydrolase [Candidatus Aminicenantes bacterium]
MKKILFISVIILLFNPVFTGEKDEKVLIVYYGRSCFEIQYLGKRIVIDPFDPDFFDYASREDKYSLPKGRVDYAFASHKAHDHNYFEGINADETYFASGEKNEFVLHKGEKTSTIKGKTTIKFQGNPFTFWTVPSYHDDQKGAVEGVNGIICFDLEGLTVVHLGDVGHVLEQKHLDAIGKVDVLMIPVDERYTIDAGTAVEIVEQLSPRIVIPMHYKTDNLKRELPFSDEKNFVKNYENVIYQDKCFISINKNDLENDLKIVVLKYFKE